MKLLPLTFSITLLFCFHLSKGQDFAQWNGPNRDGYFPSKNLLSHWPDEGPKLLWCTDSIGDGYGTVAVTDDRVFVNGKIDTLAYIFALDHQGRLIWRSSNGVEFTGKEYTANFPGPRSTPTVYGPFVYTCSGNGRISCLDKLTGKVIWSVDMLRDFNGQMDQHGYCESLLVDDQKVYCLPGGIDDNVVALNKINGEKVWSCKAFSDSATYCSPMMIKLPQRNILVTFSGHHLLGIDAASGQLLWSDKQDYSRYHQQCNTPIFSNDFLYYMAGEGNGVVKLAISADGKSITNIWKNSLTNNVFNGFVFKDGFLYSSDKNQWLKSIAEETGLAVDSVRVNKGGLIRSDSLMICYSENGSVNLIQFDKTKMTVSGKFKIDRGTKEHFAHPVIANGVLYIRHGHSLMAYDISNP
jgi:outer membrane protein assembly factor BamB